MGGTEYFISCHVQSNSVPIHHSVQFNTHLLRGAYAQGQIYLFLLACRLLDEIE
jgi:hypothetical protein